jgi:poly-gamma-glutamate synthesis protein (capsule biosynthesis protein)
MPRWLRYLLLLLLGMGLGVIYLWIRAGLSDQGSLGSGDWVVEDTLHPTPRPEPSTLKVMFAGDMMFDRNIRLAAEERILAANPEASRAAALNQVDYNFVLEDKLRSLLGAQDLVIANLEGPITDTTSLSASTEPGSTNNFFFTFDPAVVEVLIANNVWLVNLGNNHILNFDLDGLKQTDSYLQAAGVEWFGWVGSENLYANWNRLSTVWEKHGFKLGLVNYNQFGSQPLETAVAEVERLVDEVDWLIVYPHWGLEYQTKANAVIQQQAHQFIEAGADTVIGAHPHVIQQVEEYQGKKIYYSLGNFIFDQYFQPEVKQGLLVQLEFDLSQLEAESALGKELLDDKSRQLKPIYSEFYVEMVETGQTRLTASPAAQPAD